MKQLAGEREKPKKVVLAESKRGEENGPKTAKSSADTVDVGKRSVRFLMAA